MFIKEFNKIKSSIVVISLLTLSGCGSLGLTPTVSLNKAPEYPHNYQNIIAQAIQPSLKELNATNFYKVSEPQKLEYKIGNLINGQVVDGYAVCYMVTANNDLGQYKENRLFLFILDGEKVLHTSHQSNINLVENNRIYNTCNQIQTIQNKR